MRLAELEPRWVGGNQNDGLDRRGMGITFDCPLHREHRLAVMFANPIDGGECMRSTKTYIPGTQTYPPDDRAFWTRTGETFETLTLVPSIDASEFGCWHGFITNGEVT